MYRSTDKTLWVEGGRLSIDCGDHSYYFRTKEEAVSLIVSSLKKKKELHQKLTDEYSTALAHWQSKQKE